MSEIPQASILRAYGAQPHECAELLIYNENLFQISQLFAAPRLPLEDEPFVAFWEQSVAEATVRGSVAALAGKLPQLDFPVREGISGTADYLAATRRGVATVDMPEATGLRLLQPASLEIVLHQTAAGRIPLLVTRCREDFVSLVQALTRRNEPVAVPAAMGAQMVAGYNNWARLNAWRAAWEASAPASRATATWGEEMERLRSRRDLYQDRFILLSDGPYSAVPAAALGLAETQWRELSLIIRREHECVHYFTRRLFGVMRNNLLDELIADYVGMTSALGRFNGAWQLRFLGLEDAPRYRAGGRLEVYRGTPPLSDGAFAVVQRLVVSAVGNLERFDAAQRPPMETPLDRALVIAALAALRLEDLASGEAPGLLAGAYEQALTWRPALAGAGADGG